ncbi:MAG: extracellular solute-binding protein [Cellulosilyticaceae bacterium]
MRKTWTLVLTLGMAGLLTACGPNGTDATTNDVTNEGTSTDQAQEVVLEDQLVIYSTHPEDLLEVVATEFEKETGIVVDFINLKGELAEKVLAEKDNPQADIMYGGASSVFIELEASDVFEQVAPAWAESLDTLFKDEHGYWYGTIQTPVMMFYNSEMLTAEQAPKDWADLISPQFENQLVFRDGGSSSAKAMYSSLLYQYDKADDLDAGWDFMSALDKNTKKYYSSGSLQFQAVGRQEASVSFAVLNSIVDNQNKGLTLEIVDATSGSPVITDAVAMIKNAPHPNAARAFMEFVGSKELQATLATAFDRMPTLDSALETSPEWMQGLDYKVMDVDWNVLSEKQSEWMQKWDSEIKDNSKQQD